MIFSARLGLTLVLFIWLLGVFIEWIIPIFPQLAFLLPFAEKSCSLVCHQQQSKLIGESIYHTLVCSRCTGIYSGFFAVSIFSLFYKKFNEPQLKLLVIFSVPMLADVLLYSIGLYDYSKSLAFVTGLLLGSIGFLYFYPAVKKLIQELKVRNN